MATAKGPICVIPTSCGAGKGKKAIEDRGSCLKFWAVSALLFTACLSQSFGFGERIRGHKRSARGLGMQDSGIHLVELNTEAYGFDGVISDSRTRNKSLAFANQPYKYMNLLMIFCLPEWFLSITEGEHSSTAYAIPGKGPVFRVKCPKDASKFSGWLMRWTYDVSTSRDVIPFCLDTCGPWRGPFRPSPMGGRSDLCPFRFLRCLSVWTVVERAANAGVHNWFLAALSLPLPVSFV